MSDILDKINEFVEYHQLLKGDEKGEAQVFCDRLFMAFGHSGYKEAGATLEERIKKHSTKGTSFADLIWKPRLLIEMKKRGEKLHLHYDQAFQYWLNAVPNRPRYVVLCNFDEFWIYDFDKQLDEPVDKVSIDELPKRYTALNFLFPTNPDPVFGNDREKVSRIAAAKVAELFRSLTRHPGRKIPREQAQRFVLQLVVAMFSEDIDLLPKDTVTNIVKDCLENRQSSYDLFNGLFRQMNDPNPATAGRYKGVLYFNGGLFSEINPIDLTNYELELIGGDDGASTEDWSKINPAIFGTLFEQSMEKSVQHQHGRHFTSEADILRIVGPTIIRPLREEIDNAKTIKQLVDIRRKLTNFRVLDPACGSGNFLYVAYRELARLDIRLMTRLQLNFSHKEFEKRVQNPSAVSPRQFFGIDNDQFGVELAKVTLMLGKKLALDEAIETFSIGEGEYAKGTLELAFSEEQALPLENLDENIVCDDALFAAWPPADAIVGNPPYQSKNKLQEELGPAYLHKLRERHPDVDGRADYSVYWFRLAHDHLEAGKRAGLVGTNTIRQNYSREGGLDHIVANGGTITEAVSSMMWPGEADVHVSIVNWIKAPEPGSKRLYLHVGNDLEKGWSYIDTQKIGPALSFEFDVSTAKKIVANAKFGGCFQGQTHGHNGFLLSFEDGLKKIKDDKKYAQVLKPFMIADDLIGGVKSQPSRFVIDFSGMELLDAQGYSELFHQIESKVLPDREKAAKRENDRNKKLLDSNPKAKGNKHHANFLKRWWRMSYERQDMMGAIEALPRYIVCGRVTKRPIFDFVDSGISPNDAITVFAHSDDYTFGILQSSIHWAWFNARCSTLTERPRYTSNTVFDSFPWPQTPTLESVKKVAAKAIEFRAERQKLREKYKMSFRDLYRELEKPGDNPLKSAQENLDKAVRSAYGMKKSDDTLQFLLALNFAVAGMEKNKEPVQKPGLPDFVENSALFISDDCIRMA